MIHSYTCNCQRRDAASTIARLGHCVDDIGHWMAANRLQMNPAKTELLWAGSKYNISLLDRALTVQLGLGTMTASDHVRVLGVSLIGLVSRSMSPRPARLASTAFASLDPGVD